MLLLLGVFLRKQARVVPQDGCVVQRHTSATLPERGIDPEDVHAQAPSGEHNEHLCGA